MSDTDLCRVARSDPAAFGALFDRHHAAIYRYVARRLGDDTAEDVTVQTFTVAHRRLDDFDPARAELRAWLYGIAGRLMLDHRKREIRHLRRLAAAAAATPAEGNATAVDVAETVARRLDARHELIQVAHALNALAAPDREALLLFVWEELSYAAIAVAQDVPIGTVRSRIARARQHLRDTVPDIEGGSHG